MMWKQIDFDYKEYGVATTTYEAAMPNGRLIRVRTLTREAVSESIVFVPDPPHTNGPYR